jgi:hypothetical protein
LIAAQSTFVLYPTTHNYENWPELGLPRRIRFPLQDSNCCWLPQNHFFQSLNVTEKLTKQSLAFFLQLIAAPEWGASSVPPGNETCFLGSRWFQIRLNTHNTIIESIIGEHIRGTRKISLSVSRRMSDRNGLKAKMDRVTRAALSWTLVGAFHLQLSQIWWSWKRGPRKTINGFRCWRALLVVCFGWTGPGLLRKLSTLKSVPRHERQIFKDDDW